MARTRALAAEAELSEILGLVNPSSDQSVADRVRELIEDLRESQADAAQWRKVAPLIEAMRKADASLDRDEMSAAVGELLAEMEPTP